MSSFIIPGTRDPRHRGDGTIPERQIGNNGQVKEFTQFCDGISKSAKNRVTAMLTRDRAFVNLREGMSGGIVMEASMRALEVSPVQQKLSEKALLFVGNRVNSFKDFLDTEPVSMVDNGNDTRFSASVDKHLISSVDTLNGQISTRSIIGFDKDMSEADNDRKGWSDAELYKEAVRVYATNVVTRSTLPNGFTKLKIKDQLSWLAQSQIRSWQQDMWSSREDERIASALSSLALTDRTRLGELEDYPAAYALATCLSADPLNDPKTRQIYHDYEIAYMKAIRRVGRAAYHQAVAIRLFCSTDTEVANKLEESFDCYLQFGGRKFVGTQDRNKVADGLNAAVLYIGQTMIDVGNTLVDYAVENKGQSVRPLLRNTDWIPKDTGTHDQTADELISQLANNLVSGQTGKILNLPY